MCMGADTCRPVKFRQSCQVCLNKLHEVSKKVLPVSLDLKCR